MVSSLATSRHAPQAPGRGLFRFGIEEEYFLADATTMLPAWQTPDALFKRIRGTQRQFERELLQAQLEVSTRPHQFSWNARAELMELRAAATKAAAEHGLSLLACGTHPIGGWRHSVQTRKARYDGIMEGLQMLGHRNMLCAMHVHVELPDPARRIDIMARALPAFRSSWP
jgi:glutamate---cysteine ligase / carboxylate-amine ligase